VAAASSANGTAVQLWTCNGTVAQQWSHTGNTFQALGKCMDGQRGRYGQRYEGAVVGLQRHRCPGMDPGRERQSRQYQLGQVPRRHRSEFGRRAPACRSGPAAAAPTRAGLWASRTTAPRRAESTPDPAPPFAPVAETIVRNLGHLRTAGGSQASKVHITRYRLLTGFGSDPAGQPRRPAPRRRAG